MELDPNVGRPMVRVGFPFPLLLFFRFRLVGSSGNAAASPAPPTAPPTETQSYRRATITAINHLGLVGGLVVRPLAFNTIDLVRILLATKVFVETYNNEKKRLGVAHL